MSQQGALTVAGLKDMLEQRKDQIAKSLPSHLKSPDAFIRTVLTAAHKTPQILDCNPTSIVIAVNSAAELGLQIGGALGHGYLVPYKSECQFIPGYRGLIDLARRAGDFRQFQADVVRDGDLFEYEKGLDPKLRHVPSADVDRTDNDNITHAYAIARGKDGEWQFEVMTRGEIDAIKKRSRTSGSGPWVTDFPEMSKKTAVRRLIKYLPLSAERAGDLNKALQLDDADYETNASDSARTAPPPMPKGKQSVRKPAAEVEIVTEATSSRTDEATLPSD